MTTPNPDPVPMTGPHLYSVPREPGAPAPTPRPRTAWTADQLMAAEFPEPRWAVPGILSEGVNLLAGPPKVGKSWLSLGLGLSVAAGGKAMDAVPVEGGPVLYLALEDTPRRLQTRMRKLLGGRPAPAGLTLVTECPPLPQGGNEAIAGWLDNHPDARMVVIDVFAKMRGPSAPGASAYDADYAAVGHAKRIADHYGVAVVLVHHVRKAGSDDFLTEVSGTNGLAGAADATLVLKRARGKADGVLHVTGRDVDEAEYALQFHAAAGAWQLLEGPAADHTIGDTRAAILRHVRSNPGARPKDIAAAMPDVDADTVRRTCSRMAADGQLCKDAAGRYYPDPDTKQTAQGASGVSDRPAAASDQPELPGHPGSALSGCPASSDERRSQ
ncbi:AAA family ATPase [Streptomyces sp. S1A]|uniref:AAA family ATPase n=1 Tax=Streptomyces sp. ICN903 TaxID=2964654 RepID=UPI001EDB0E0A|nr:AAA family ATPase [Streptomyces sp. ICN903]MCG3041934.1 AAA family ATPase [Streptomyces sp. ICN903]